LGVKILKFLSADPGWKKFGSGMEKSRIRDPQHWGEDEVVANLEGGWGGSQGEATAQRSMVA